MLGERDAYTERAACPLYTAIAVIEGRWKPMLFRRLLEMPRGFGDLQRAIPRVSTKVLREQLRQMVWRWGVTHLEREGSARGTVVPAPLAPPDSLSGV